MTSDCVIVVCRDDGVWDASCWDDRRDDDGNWASDGFPTEAAARRAAARHRAELKAETDAAKRCDNCGQHLPTPYARSSL